MRGVIRWPLKLRTGNYAIVVFRANSLRNVVGWPGSVEWPFETLADTESETQVQS